MEQPKKHPTFQNRPVPSFQLLSKLSKFQGERKDILAKNPQDILASTRNANEDFQTMMDSPNPNGLSQTTELVQQYQQRIEERKQKENLEKEFEALMDPNYKPPDANEEKEKKSHRYKYNAHMNSSVGKLFSKPEENPENEDVQEWQSQSKRMVNPKVSNFNNSVIGGQAPAGDPWQTTTQAMGTNDNPLNKKAAHGKKLAHQFEPELFVSPITGEPIADYGSWKEDIKKGDKPQPKEDPEDKVVDDPLLNKLKTQLSLRGAKGIIGLGRVFRIMDDDGSNSLSFQEFKKAMKEYGVALSDSETILLFKKFDVKNTGSISYNTFLTTIAGALNKRRARLVNLAFDVMDKDGSGEIELSDLTDAYDASKHPDVISGKKSKDQVLLEFLDTFTAGGNDDQKITRDEFQNYYAAISASIDKDDYFELMIRNAWHISGGEGASANSANRRVLVIKSDGSQEVVEIKNDLGLNMKDTKEILKRLKAQGVDAIQVSVNDNTESIDPPANAKGKPNLNRHGNKTTVAAEKEKDKSNPTNVPSAGTKLLIDKVKKALKLRGVNSFFDLQKRFKIMDDDHSGNISYSEFKKAIKEIQSLQDLSENDIRTMFTYFDRDGSNSVDFNEFISGIRDPMNDHRLSLVKRVFNKFDNDGNGFIEINDIINVYDTSKHPEVIAKRKTKNQVLTEFLQNFEVDGVIDGKVTFDEFINYYHNISASIDNDNYFELMICNAWHINPNEDEKATNKKNTTNLRVMVTNSQGVEEVVTLDNDLGINNSNKDDLKLLYARLKQQGVNDIMAINGKIIKVVNINGVDIITTIGNTSTLKEDTNDKYNPKANAPNVVRAPPFRPQTTSGAANSALNASMNSRPRPVAGLEMPPPSSGSSTQNKPVVIQSTSNTPAKYNMMQSASDANKLAKDPRKMANNIISNLNKRKAINQKLQEENIVGNTLLDVLKVQLLSKGVSGIVELQRKFSEFDVNQNAIIDLEEFQAIFKSLNLAFSNDQIETLFNFLDRDGSNGIDYLELLEALRGPINPQLLILIHQIFDKLDKYSQNAVKPEIVIQNFHPNRHPEVMCGNCREEDIMQEFLDTFDVGNVQAGYCTRDEFVKYYHNVNMVTNDDSYLELVLRRVWDVNEDDDLIARSKLQQQQQRAKSASNLNNSASNSLKDRLQSAKTFGNENYNNAVPNPPINRMNNTAPTLDRRPSTSSGQRYSNPNTPRGMNAQNNGNQFQPQMSIQGSQFVGDQSMPPPLPNNGRPKSAAAGGRGYQLMSNNPTPRSNSQQSVTPRMAEEKANNLRRDAILEFNAGNFKDALELFKLVLQIMQALYPPNHPECVKAEKSILLAQRKLEHAH